MGRAAYGGRSPLLSHSIYAGISAPGGFVGASQLRMQPERRAQRFRNRGESSGCSLSCKSCWNKPGCWATISEKEPPARSESAQAEDANRIRLRSRIPLGNRSAKQKLRRAENAEAETCIPDVFDGAHRAAGARFVRARRSSRSSGWAEGRGFGATKFQGWDLMGGTI